MANNRREQKPKTKEGKSKTKINSKDIMIHSANKMGRHMDDVKRGAGIHKTHKDKCRKKKWNQDDEE